MTRENQDQSRCDEMLRGVHERLGAIGETGPYFLEMMHCHAVDLQRRGLTQAALFLYRRIRACSARTRELEAWTWFKEAEALLQAGDKPAAQNCLARTLAISPRHTKALLLLHPQDKPLAVSYGEKGKAPADCLHLSFPSHDLDSWNYYLGARPADQLWLAPPLRLLEFAPDTLREILTRFVSAGGGLVFAIDGGLLRLSREECLAMLTAPGESFRQRFLHRLTRGLA